MAIDLISKIKPKNNGDFKLVDVRGHRVQRERTG